ncbi:hypothetical protein V6N11_035307 [Hibiscus sabdariffa]|uniref:Uncharacterized protein n=1 Tax=Hibiscus sabdariffa TaxID=183260 RepID=A0ABR2R0P3_9ROSI
MLYSYVEAARLGEDITGGVAGAFSVEDSGGPGGEAIDGEGAIPMGEGDELTDGVGVGGIDGVGVVGTMRGGLDMGDDVGVAAGGGVTVAVGGGAPRVEPEGGIAGDAEGL